MSRHWPRMVATLIPLLIALFHAVGVWQIGLLERMEALIYDVRMRATMPQTLDDRIVIVDIDEKSLAETGRWPWPRNKLAALTNILFEQQHIAMLGFDVVFAEPDDSSGLSRLSELMRQPGQDTELVARFDKIRNELDYDAAFAKSLQNRPVVLGYYFTSENEGRTSGVLPAPVMKSSELPVSAGPYIRWSGFGANIRPLANAAPLAGFINSITDPDGIVRALPLVVQHDSSYYESLSLAMFRQLVHMPHVRPGYVADTTTRQDGSVLQSIVLSQADRSFSIPVDERVAVRVPYRGNGGVHGGAFSYVSASDLLAGRVPAGHLSGKIILVGSTAPGVVDLRATPVSVLYPGIEVHASLLSAMLDRRFLVKPDYALGVEVVLLLVLGLMLVVFIPKLSAVPTLLLAGGAAAGVIALNMWLYLAWGLVLALASHLFLIFATLVVSMGYGYFVETRAKRDLIQLFGTYVPPELVDEMLEDPDHYNMRARSQVLTVMFCDMRGFTQMSENMEPVALQHLLNGLFSELTHLIRENRGTVDKYMGDCVMAFWGAPVATSEHAGLAVRTALAMNALLGRMNVEKTRGVRSDAGEVIEMGIGLNTGSMCVGDMGSDIRRSYTVIGNAVNVGSRLEGLSKVYGVPIVVSETTREQAQDYVWQELDRVRVKGAAKSIAIFTPLAAVGTLSQKQEAELALWQTFLTSYRGQSWAQCDMLIGQLQETNCTKPLYRLYAQRVAELREQTPGSGWDGATNFETK